MSNEMPKEMERIFDRLWPLNRSITGPDFRKSLDILAEIMPTERLRFESGQQVFDWIVPPEWRVREAYFIDPTGKRHADVKVNNLHLVGYSVPFQGTMSLEELLPHLYTLPHLPDAIPYITSYYKPRWGFCLSENEKKQLPPGQYKVHVETELVQGHLELGEAVLPGETDEEILITAYLCHPSMANNELSGPLVASFLYQRLQALPRRRFTYRFLLSAETIGTISYLSVRGEHLKKKVHAGYVLNCIGTAKPFVYKLSRDEKTPADRAALQVLRTKEPFHTVRFDPGSGSDERHFCSPGFNLPMGSVMRSVYWDYPEYHTSLDNKSFISFEALRESVDTLFEMTQALEHNLTWRNLMPYGEPRLDRRGLYPNLVSNAVLEERVKAILWILNFSDGQHDLLSISERSGLRMEALIPCIPLLLKAGLIEPLSCPEGFLKAYRTEAEA